MTANVNKPVVKEVKEADINRKLQVYGIISAFQNGKLPSNDQIDIALNSFLASKALAKPSNKLSSDGQRLVQEVRDVVEQAKFLLLSKNEGNLLQDFIYQATQFDPKHVNAPGAPINKDTAQRDGDEALQGLRTLGTLLITNGQFRKLLKDSITLLRDIAGDAATNAAGKVRPSGDELSQLDAPAEDNTWHEKPDFSKENMRKQAQGVYGGDIRKDAKDIASSGADAANADPHHPEKADTLAGQRVTTAAAKHKISENLDDETKDKLKQRNEHYRRQTREYFNKKMPQERKDQIIFRLKKMILECQQHPDYSEAIQTLLRLAENYGKHGHALGKGSASTAKDARGGFSAAEADLRTLIERFANGTSTSDLWDSINQIYKDAEKDNELRDFFQHLDSYIRRCLLEQGYILEDESSREWDHLYDQGRYMLREKYRTHTDRVVDEIKFIADQFDQDAQNTRFANSVQKLFTTLGNDENGKPVFKPHLIKDLTEVILPGIFTHAAYIPIPRIEYTDPQFDAVIENLILESDNFMPNLLELESENHFTWGRKKIVNKHKNTAVIKVAGVQMDLRDVSYHIKRKQGFPSITDTGVVDVILPGDGFSFKIKVSSADKKDRQNFFKVEKVDIDFKQLDLKVKQSNHKLLFSLFKPIALKAMRPALQKAVEKAIKDQFNQMDSFLYEVKKEVDKVQDQVKSDPSQASNIYQRYYDAFQKRMLQGKEKAKAASEDKKVNVAMTKEDSIFPNLHMPGGISSKATEYRELARKGDKWESPVFSIGSAKRSSNIPAAPKIQRKPHSVATSHGPTGNGHGLTGGGYGHGDHHGQTSGYSTGVSHGQTSGYSTGVSHGNGLGGNGMSGHGLSGNGNGFSHGVLNGNGNSKLAGHNGALLPGQPAVGTY